MKQWTVGVRTQEDVHRFAETLFGDCEKENLLAGTPFDRPSVCFLIRRKAPYGLRGDWNFWPKCDGCHLNILVNQKGDNEFPTLHIPAVLARKWSIHPNMQDQFEKWLVGLCEKYTVLDEQADSNKRNAINNDPVTPQKKLKSGGNAIPLVEHSAIEELLLHEVKA